MEAISCRETERLAEYGLQGRAGRSDQRVPGCLVRTGMHAWGEVARACWDASRMPGFPAHAGRPAWGEVVARAGMPCVGQSGLRGSGCGPNVGPGALRALGYRCRAATRRPSRAGIRFSKSVMCPVSKEYGNNDLDVFTLPRLYVGSRSPPFRERLPKPV